MAYINTTTNEYPISEQDIRNLFFNTSFPTVFSPPEDYAYVFPTPIPDYNPITQYYIGKSPILTSKGIWAEQWEIVDYPQEQIIINQEEQKNQIKTSIVQQTQQRLDDFANTKNYDGIMSCCTYASSTNQQFISEAEYCISARDATWTTLYQILSDVENNIRPIPSSFTEIEPELPVLEWTN